MESKHPIQTPQVINPKAQLIHPLRRRGLWASPPVLHFVPTAPPGGYRHPTVQTPKQWPIHVIGRGRP
jgi:hypothetical protein